MNSAAAMRDPVLGGRLLDAIARKVTRPWRLMEVCGGQTHALLRYGLESLLPASLHLIHGPGCPVCVTPVELVDRAIALAARPEIILCSFGDMLRVPGSDGSLLSAKARGGDVRMVYSPTDALDLARKHPEREVVFFAVGFETTAPTTARAVYDAHREGIANFSMLVSHVRVPPALVALLEGPDRALDGLLAAGHVCTVMGTMEYAPIAARYRLPIVVTGFEPVDLLAGILACVTQLEEGRAEVENAYARVAREEGNVRARRLIEEVFAPVDRAWRGIGPIPESGFGLRPPYDRYDAERRFDVGSVGGAESPLCRSGDVLRGVLRPTECPAFGRECTPLRPLGAPMVSAEGACAAYHRYGRAP